MQGESAEKSAHSNAEGPTNAPYRPPGLDLITAEAEEEFERLDRDRLQHELLAFAVDDDEDDGDDNGEPEDERGDDDEDDALALDPDSDEDDIQGGGDDDNDVG